MSFFLSGLLGEIGKHNRFKICTLRRVTGSSPVCRPVVGNAPVAQLDRASDFESEGRGFDSLQAHSGNSR